MIRHPAWRGPTILLAMLSLSIGWGIRGNFGHEYGAMVPGALCALAVCLASGREDWRARARFFALFGALGWAFGGSIAYMPTISYTHSGHLPTQLYGFGSVFLVGFLWAGMGGAGTAYAAVEEREQLTATIKPLCWILAIWTVEYFWPAPARDFRQQNPFYWLDSEWIEASLALIALCLFDLWDRRFAKAHWLAVLAAAGALAGWFLAGWLRPLLPALVRAYGDVTNWPQVFFDLGRHLGWILGAVAGAAVYFWRYGQWRSGAALLLHITLGSYIVFLAAPVLLGLRLTPPRGDSWANCLGAFLGMLVYMRRRKLAPVTAAALVAGVTGGLGFMLAQFLKLVALMPGNPALTQDPAVILSWAHWRSANWHSILTEQGVGLFYGLGIALALAMLATRVPPAPDRPPVRPWTEAFSVAFILNLLVYVNLVKNVADWTRKSVPPAMKAPLVVSIQLSARGWFNLMFALIAICTVALLALHLRRPLAVAPRTALGKGQLFYLLFLWIMVIGNFEKALVNFHEQRLATEFAIMVNALAATFLILWVPRENETLAEPQPAVYAPLVRRALLTGAAGLTVCTLLFTGVVRSVYGDRHDGWGNRNLRFGPDADWRTKPILKDRPHR